MKYKLNGKVFTLLGVIFILYVGLMSIKGIVYDRISNKYRAISSIEKTNAGPQSVLGPVILINYSYQVDALDSVLEKGKYIRKIQNHAKRQIVLPIKLNFDVSVPQALNLIKIKIYRWLKVNKNRDQYGTSFNVYNSNLPLLR